MKKVLIALGIVAIVGVGGVVVLRYYPAYRDMQLIMHSPQVKIIPQSFTLSQGSETYAHITRHSYEDFSYLVPSDTAPEERPYSTIYKVQLSEDKEITFLQKDDTILLTEFLKDDKSSFEGLIPFEIERRILHSTPFGTDSDRDTRKTNMKMMAVKFGLITKQPIYEFEANYVKGFQFGKLDSENMSVRTDFYVNEQPYSLVSRGLTQVELNYLLLSIRSN